MKPLHIIYAAVFGIFVGPTWAHVDTLLQLREGGSVQGLPKIYSNARLRIDLGKRKAGEYPLILSVSGKEYKLPACALSPVKTKNEGAARVAGSWYHSSELPHYIYVKFPDPNQPKDAIEEIGVVYLFNIQKPTLMKIEQVVYDGPNAVGYREFFLSSLCDKK